MLAYQLSCDCDLVCAGISIVFAPCDFQLLAVIMCMISVVLMIASVAGPDWMEVYFYQGEVKSWGLWWDCFKVTGSLEMCIETGEFEC